MNCTLPPETCTVGREAHTSLPIICTLLPETHTALLKSDTIDWRTYTVVPAIGTFENFMNKALIGLQSLGLKDKIVIKLAEAYPVQVRMVKIF
jgi:hypothetical protein